LLADAAKLKILLGEATATRPSRPPPAPPLSDEAWLAKHVPRG
jgi:hypothetical protein